NPSEILLLRDGHCFREGILNLCNVPESDNNQFRIESGSFETLIRLVDEGLGITLLPYMHTLNLSEREQTKIRHFAEPRPAREVSLIFPQSELKKHIIEALRNTIAGVVRGAVAFQNVQIISPKAKK